MIDSVNITLNNIDPDDISDVLVKIEKSFDFKFGKTELEDVKTFGELCDIITTKIQGVDTHDCTTQQAFYKLRNALIATCDVGKAGIDSGSKLEVLFPRKNRRKQLRKLQNILGVPVNILDIPKSWGWIILTGVIISLGFFFIQWQYAVVGLIFFLTSGIVANRYFARELELLTVRELVEKISRENYFKVRRNQQNLNRVEIEKIVISLFSGELYLEKTSLTREATFQ